MSDCCLTQTQQFFSYIMARKKLFAMSWWWGPVCTRPTPLVWFLIVLAHRNNSPPIDMLPHSDTLSWFRANQSLLFLLNAACLARSNTYQFYSSTIYHTRGEHGLKCICMSLFYVTFWITYLHVYIYSWNQWVDRLLQLTTLKMLISFYLVSPFVFGLLL